MTRGSKQALFWIGGAFLVAVGVLYAWVDKQFDRRSALAVHVGSAGCVRCHIDEFADWQDSLHPKMMRRVEQPGVVVADLSPDHPDLLFDPAEAVWAIGSKWQQQFMGEDAHGETLLPGEWQVAAGRWKTTGWDGWQVPNPLVRCHGCHTVGLNVETGHFVEPGIGCESCHGQGGWHEALQGFGGIANTLDAEVCGQCHARGRSLDGATFFPVGYQPGERLADYFVEDEPDLLQNSSAWWGNGSERKRHQQYSAWKVGGHANSLRSVREDYDGRFGPVDSSCLRCHAAEAAIDPGRAHRPADMQHGITCAVCHNVHGALDAERVGCGDCHSQGAYHHRTEALQDHVPCPDSAGVSCVDCHMPKTGINGGEYNVNSHRPGIVEPKETERFGVPSSCANGGCHSGVAPAELQEMFEAHYRHATADAAPGPGLPIAVPGERQAGGESQAAGVTQGGGPTRRAPEG